MPLLRRHRRDHRAIAPKKRKRRNLVKFIPEADSDFAFTAHNFVSWLKREPETFGLTSDEVQTVANQVQEFRDVLAAVTQARVDGADSPQLIRRKDAMRRMTESTVRMFANIIRANPRVDPTKKSLLRIKVRPAKLGKKKCPKPPPRLQYVGSGDGVVGGVAPGSGSGVHVLKFWCDYDSMVVNGWSSNAVRRAKPDGAVRIELFFDMIPAGENVPQLPGERGWPKYLRSFTKSPMEVQFPIPTEPMLIVYWARWADSSGEVSRWSKPCIARVEGWTANKPALPEATSSMTVAGRVETKYVYVQTPIAGELPESGSLAGDLEAAAFSQKLLEAGVKRLMSEA